MIQKLPLEIVTVIAGYLPIEDTAEFAKTCQKCYFAVLPHIWHHLSLSSTNELSIVAKRLQTNSLWSQRAVQFVRDVSLCRGCDEHKKFSSAVAASMFGIASTPTDQESERSEKDSIKPHERIGNFGRRLLELFPHISNLVLDFAQAARNFYNTPDTTVARLPFSGSLSLVNYKSDNTKFMHNLLAPFRKTHHLRVQALPVVSLCDDIDESILSNADIADLATLGLTHLRRLELSYLDSDISLDTFKKLLQSLPHLEDLVLEWIFPPSKSDYQQLCQILEKYGSLVPEKTEKKSNILRVHFVYKS
ncbi:unnamed protein product [Mucor hiemalis]